MLKTAQKPTIFNGRLPGFNMPSENQAVASKRADRVLRRAAYAADLFLHKLCFPSLVFEVQRNAASKEADAARRDRK